MRVCIGVDPSAVAGLFAEFSGGAGRAGVVTLGDRWVARKNEAVRNLVSCNVARSTWPCFFTGWKPVPQNSVQFRKNGRGARVVAPGSPSTQTRHEFTLSTVEVLGNTRLGGAVGPRRFSRRDAARRCPASGPLGAGPKDLPARRTPSDHPSALRNSSAPAVLVIPLWPMTRRTPESSGGWARGLSGPGHAPGHWPFTGKKTSIRSGRHRTWRNELLTSFPGSWQKEDCLPSVWTLFCSPFFMKKVVRL